MMLQNFLDYRQQRLFFATHISHSQHSSHPMSVFGMKSRFFGKVYLSYSTDATATSDTIVTFSVQTVCARSGRPTELRSRVK